MEPEGGGAHGQVGQPTWSAEQPVGPTTFRFHVEVDDWLLMSV